jgi:hypothetical protein
MRSKVGLLYGVLALGLVAACGDDDSGGGKADGGHKSHRDAGRDKTDAAGGDDAGMVMHQELDGGERAAGKDEGIVSEYLADAGDGFKSLIQAHWVLPAQSEQYRCARFTVPEDATIHSFRSLSPLGTHHTVLTVTHEPKQPDGLTVCGAATNASSMLAGSGVGTNDFTLPEGVAIKVRKGDQLLLNLHLFNVSDKDIEGTSGTLVKLMADNEVVHEAEAVLGGPIDLNIPAHSKGVVQSGACTLVEDATLFAVAAHAHMHATHIKVTAHSSIDGDVVLSDRPYSFESQVIYNVDPMVKMKKGDQVQVDCTYDNDGDETINFGDSSLAEMCFAGFSRFPAVENPRFPCIE